MNRVIVNRGLLILVIIIWGIVLYKYINAKEKKSIKKEKVIDGDFVVNKKLNKAVELFFFEKDPFLGTHKKKPKTKLKVEKTIVKKKVKKINSIKWPFIKYLGVIKKENGDKLALLKVTGTFVKLKKGVKQDNYDFYVHEIYRDSILLKMNNERKIIKK